MSEKRSNQVPTHLTDQQLAGLDAACRAAERASAPGAKVTRSSYLAALLDTALAALAAQTSKAELAAAAPPAPAAKGKGARS